MTTPLLLGQRLVITLAAMLSILPTTKAQISLDVSPYAGLFVPLRSMFVWTGQPYYSYGTLNTVALQKTIAVGGRLIVWPVRRFGIEATFGYAPSGVTIGCRVPACNAGHAITGSAKAVVLLNGVNSRRSLYLGGGVGHVDLGGNAWEGVTLTTRVGPTVGAGVELKSTSAGSLRIEAEDYLFRPHFGPVECDASWGACRVLPPYAPYGTYGSWKQQFQHVVILSIGWVFRGGGPRP